ncbi:hypothetical protein Deipr_0718 [Deinococcus proteolyticus MRP]|uniref:Uncharacterized protein n=1 Tax=Deinococcus proteolyticus (strain ATCC 35074 / DSM 20540 / JCM 6276 / NBRC 101906 / NCIMB 13154 / VKM Ac-1939 / CCM 2703 / MRP) TaxID=693977 RepID=F0RLN9_DEIPM|nr:hypothetical protein [Deinococcus proteolyticus]ADY25878.1 hypothetical protein Deipr_0718 [Deinococcus proteolyticus MRP]
MFNPPTLEDLQETRRANEKLVLEALDSKPEWVETELAKTTGLALSHLRAALASLLDQGRVRRLPGTGTRAVYGLADPGLADVPATPLTEDALRIREYLEGRADSALYMSDQLRLTREEVMAALSLLNAHGMITCTFVGSLVIFRLKEQQALDAEAAEAAAAAEAGVAPDDAAKPAAKKAAAPKATAPKTVAKKAADADGADPASSAAKPAKKAAAPKAAAKPAAKKAAPKKAASKDAGREDTEAAASAPAVTAEPAGAEPESAESASAAKKPVVRKRVKKPLA